MKRAGVTLLETMVALVILGLVVLAFLEVFGLSARSSRDTEIWARAVSYAQDGMEFAKLDLQQAVARGREPLEGGYVRQIGTRPVEEGLERVSVIVTFPDGGRFVLDRLVSPP
jgi:prepilin-type N-terminal cleavage/methylation domain-containing protein